MKTTADKSPVIKLRLRTVMETKGVTVLELSEKSGVPRQTIYNILRSPVGIQFDTLAKLCVALGVNPNSILEVEEVKR